jgi:hypothetical protein
MLASDPMLPIPANLTNAATIRPIAVTGYPSP